MDSRGLELHDDLKKPPVPPLVNLPQTVDPCCRYMKHSNFTMHLHASPRSPRQNIQQQRHLRSPALPDLELMHADGIGSA